MVDSLSLGTMSNIDWRGEGESVVKILHESHACHMTPPTLIVCSLIAGTLSVKPVATLGKIWSFTVEG